MGKLLEHIVAHGNRHNPLTSNYATSRNEIVCADGFELSVIAGWGTYCSPRPGGWPREVPDDYAGPYQLVEAWPDTPRPAAWHQYAENAADTCLSLMSAAEECTCDGVCGFVPVDLVRELIELHGGER